VGIPPTSGFSLSNSPERERCSKEHPLTQPSSATITPASSVGFISTVESRTISIPLRQPLSFSTRYVERREYTLVRICTSENVEGMGYCYCGNRAGQLVTQFVRDFFRDHLVGADPLARQALWTAMHRDSVLLGRRGAALRAMSAIDLALWDLFGK